MEVIKMVKNNSYDFSVKREIEHAVITEDIAIVHITETVNNEIIRNKVIFHHPSKLDELSEFKIKEDFAHKNTRFMHKEFLQYYKTTNRPNDIKHITKTYGIDNDTLWEGIKNNTINLDDYIPTETSFYDYTIYPFKYGETKYGWFPHMKAYSSRCYMVTNAEYNLKRLSEFLQHEESMNNVAIRRGFYDEIIQSVPYYNINNTDGNEYINFLCRVDTKEEDLAIENDFINKKWEKLIEPYRLRRKV